MITSSIFEQIIKTTENEVNTQNNFIDDDASDSGDKIYTTEEELEGFYIVKSILRDNIESERITYRDAQSYFRNIHRRQ